MAETENMLSAYGSLLDVAATENAAIRDNAFKTANLARGRGSVYLSSQSGGMLMQNLADMAGMKTIDEERQETIESILDANRNLDPNDPETLYTIGQQFSDAGFTGIAQKFIERGRELYATQFTAETARQESEARGVSAEAAKFNALQNRPTIEVGNPDNPQQTIRMELVDGKYEVMLDPEGKPYIEDKFTSQLTGNLAEDYRAILDENGIVIGAEPIPGSLAHQKQLADEKALAFKKQYEIVNVSRQLENIDVVIDMYNNRISDKKIGPFDANIDTIFSTAAKAFAVSKVPGTPRENMNEALAPIIANIGFDKLQAMREASPTGGALGQVSNIELAALQKSLASLSLNQTAESFYANVLKVQRHYRNMIKLMSADGSESIEDLKLDNKYEVTTDETTGEVTVTLVPRDDADEPAF
jgi:hypothetical protein